MGIFDKIDFHNLPKDLNERGIREEIVNPFLNELGYSIFNEQNKIIVEPHLKHPFTQFGTKTNRNTLIPDYLIKVNNSNAFIVEVKKLSENILTGKNVEQAYSYAINRQVQVKRFVLCNGKEMAIFDVNKEEPLLYFEFCNVTKEILDKVYKLLSPMAFINPSLFNYKPDYGIWCLRKGITHLFHEFRGCYILDVARLEDDLFTFTAVINEEEEELLASFDFDMSLFEDFMKQVPDDLKDTVRDSIRKSPFKYMTNSEDESFKLSFLAYLSDTVIKNEYEDYLPLKVMEFI